MSISKKLSGIIVALILAAIAIAIPPPPDFVPGSVPSSITCYQNSTCFFDFNATDTSTPPDPINYSIDTPPFSENIDANTGIMNFTPTNDDVGTYPYTWVIVKELDTGDGNFRTVTWYILNINDPPNITAYWPENLTNSTVKEAHWLMFNVTADDIDLQYNDTLNYTWMLDGKVNQSLLNWTNETANYTPDYLSAGIRKIRVNVSDNQSATAWIEWTVNVTNENRLCVQNGTIPNITFAEDTNVTDLFFLVDYFNDPDIDDTFTYSYINNTNITISINATNNQSVSFFPDPNFFGINNISFRCYDGYNLSNWSNTVVVNVTGVQDPPTVEQLADQIAYVDSLFNAQVIAYDVDYDALTYSNNHTELFIINPTNGSIAFTPTIGQVGNYSVKVNATDGNFNTSMIFNLSIYNNSAPVLDPIGNRSAQEGQPFTLQINATDADPIESLVFDYECLNCTGSVHETIFAVTTTNSSPVNATGTISFTSTNDDVGDWLVTYYVNDTRSAFDSETITISIQNINFPPVLDPIPHQIFKVNETFNLTVNATDPDGDITTFADNTTLFDIVNQQLGLNAVGFISIYTTVVANTSVNISVTDSTGNTDWQEVWFNSTLNRPPEILQLENITTTEDNRTIIQISATDPDPQDQGNLLFWDNMTLFDIENYTGIIDFTPNSSDVGNYSVNITVSDGEYNVSMIFNLSISFFNDNPLWLPPLESYFVNESNYLTLKPINSSALNTTPTNRTVWNSSIWQNNETIILMAAYDEESIELNFSSVFISFTNASNDTITSGISLFTIAQYDNTTAILDFTPTNDDVGIYTVNFTVDDKTGKQNTTTIEFIVYNVNDQPTITSTSPEENVSMLENESQMFNVTATDIDYGDSVTFKWYYEDSLITGETSDHYNFTASFFSAGNRTLKVSAEDSQNLTTNYTWNLNITNVNRPGWFGEIRQTNYTDFAAGNLVNTYATAEGTVTLLDSGSGYPPSGVYESPSLDSRESNYFHNYTTINWTANTTQTDVQMTAAFQVRTDRASNGGCPTTLTTNYTTAFVTQNYDMSSLNNDQCIQYKVTLTTNDSTATPVLDAVTLGYKIADYEQEQSTNSFWIYLNDYFQDPDNDYPMIFNVTQDDGSPVDTTKLNITIDPSTSRVNVITNPNYWGTADVLFHMTDGEYNVTSNVVTITITEIQPIITPIIIPTGGGGGGVTMQPVEVEVDRYIPTPIAFRLIAPTKVTTYENDTIEIPINLFNDGNFSIEDLELEAETENEYVTLQLSKTRIASIPAKNKDFVMLTAESLRTYGDYEILVTAKGESVSKTSDGGEIRTPFEEKAKIFISSLLKAEGNDSMVNTKLSFAQDLLESNPECLELNEFLQKSKALLDEGQEAEAKLMLDKIVESCKYLIAPREKLPEAEAPEALRLPKQPLYVLVTVALLTLIIAASLVVGWAHMKHKASQYKRNI